MAPKASKKRLRALSDEIESVLFLGQVDSIAAADHREDGLQQAYRLISAQNKNTWPRKQGRSKNWKSIKIH